MTVPERTDGLLACGMGKPIPYPVTENPHTVGNGFDRSGKEPAFISDGAFLRLRIYIMHFFPLFLQNSRRKVHFSLEIPSFL